MHANTMQKSRARRGRRRMKPMEAYEFRTPDKPYNVKKYWQRRHRINKTISWGKHQKSRSQDWS